MGLEYLSIDSNKVKDILNSRSFRLLKEEKEQNLDISMIKYGIEIKDGLAEDEYGYKVPGIKAKTIFFNDYSSVDKIVFYVDSFIYWINRKFGGKLIDNQENKKILDEICKIVINLALVHELIHISQLKEGKISKEIIDIEKNKKYEDKSYEREAIDLSCEIIGKYGEFEFEIIKIINSNEAISGDQIIKLVKLYDKLKELY